MKAVLWESIAPRIRTNPVSQAEVVDKARKRRGAVHCPLTGKRVGESGRAAFPDDSEQAALGEGGSVRKPGAFPNAPDGIGGFRQVGPVRNTPMRA